MTITNETKISKATEGYSVTITRDFNAPLAKIWRAWTEPELLDKWWAPKPMFIETQAMDFSVGGKWFFIMNFPDGNKIGFRVNFNEIDPKKSFKSSGGAADFEGNIAPETPQMKRVTKFTDNGDTTHVEIEITFENEAHMQAVAEGASKGTAAAFTNLDELLSE